MAIANKLYLLKSKLKRLFLILTFLTNFNANSLLKARVTKLKLIGGPHSKEKMLRGPKMENGKMEKKLMRAANC